ncbi:autotransporter domain-containing protein, partial [Fusobacterium ulcerans]|uniref:beta strand repeat-containing protein n=1 Tax=Fusobacterium ulcerans TaxID=861 RepID=UPI000FF1BE5D
MIEKIMKAVKSGNKKRGRNITVGAVVGMLLSCTAVMGADEYLWIKNDGGIKFSTDNSTPTSTENPYGENTWNGTDYVNNIILNSTSSGYGLKLSGDLSGINFTNNGLIAVTGNNLTCGISNEGTIGDITNTGLITGTSAGNSYGNDGNGIYNAGTMGNITNRGLIIGRNTGSQYGHGIYNDYRGNKIGDITNTGLIIGTTIGDANGYGIYNKKTIGDIINIGLIIGIGNVDGDGIYNAGTMGIVMNTGLIAGIGKLNGRGIYIGGSSIITASVCNEGVIIAQGKAYTYGIANDKILTEGIINNGLISLINTEELNAAGSNSYGISALNSGTTKTIKNNGLIIGRSINGENNCGIHNQGDGVRVSNIGSVVNIATGTGNVYGVSNSNGHYSHIASIVNSGLITGTNTGSGTAYGILNKQHESNGGEIGDIANTGVIYGKTNTVKNETGGKINSLVNYGILTTEGNSIIDNTGTITNTPTNYGLYIAEADGKVSFDDTKQSNSPVEIIVGHDDSGNEIKRNMTIKNA